jgi:hypothetical protein
MTLATRAGTCPVYACGNVRVCMHTCVSIYTDVQSSMNMNINIQIKYIHECMPSLAHGGLCTHIYALSTTYTHTCTYNGTTIHLLAQAHARMVQVD